ncbi:hypothetical protein SLV14_006914 [Streptomyces sp. Je 1-4]|uniref:hypothetical protein n=1 Tax=Streptomyces TaxID=1883 RepID=UPI000D20EEAF|nr:MULTISPECIES: hypothetical protein [unclassified Streptomyces]AVV61978.1 putative secreted protein [Streptomyces sp. ID38640]QIK10128.1 hypothetical protein G7Z12_32740 [Streptomyces sp. ID38640]UYB43881.1 hypothetical protein SLV14_006914 [Streptomyces sp. Je 1-4]UZQ40301.1 hypothetical protein SLV14N_006914 [Streptomyces sp. Je 1-4] [Streptomyces sp. Je 1-4 4N24]UZQ47718.1 hypothetical protein SLV14NA_006914 [Streptomyces sp. Je 1-4] [Streptomyces sp. Je 1-4 4N24_ara]
MPRGAARVRVLALALVLLTAGCTDKEHSNKSSELKNKASACVKALRIIDLVPDPKKAEDYEKKGKELRDLAKDVRDREVAKAMRQVAHQYGMARVEAARDFGRVAVWVKGTVTNIKTLKKVCA